MVLILEIGVEVDLSGFSSILWREGIRHRITEQAGKQLLWVADEDLGRRAAVLYEEMRAGRLKVATPDAVSVAPFMSMAWFGGARRVVARNPVTIMLVVICFAFYPLTIGYEENQLSELLHWVTFTDFQTRGHFVLFASLTRTLQSWEIWRLWTPIFIHFGMLHLVFNLVLVWVCGQRIELLHGKLALILVTALTALVSNLAQYGLSGPGLFGGMSGVVYGYFGYCFVWSRMRPERSFGLPTGIYVFMLLWLLVGFAGFFDLFLAGSMANGAHLGGLVGGLALGFAAVGLAVRR